MKHKRTLPVQSEKTMIHGIRIVALTLLLTLFGCQSAEEKAKRQIEEHKQQEAARAEREIAYMNSHYNAIVDWPQQLNGMTFSIDVEPVFVRADHRPALFYAILEDIRRSNDTIFLYFLTVPTEHEPSLQLILDCGGCDVLAFKNSDKKVGEFGVVAQVTAAVKSLDTTEDAPDYELHGKFIDARFIGDYAMDKSLASQPEGNRKSE
jgi:hypothetical protein